MKSSSVLAAALFVGAAMAGPKVEIGCYKVSTGVTLNDTSIYNSIGHCGGKICLDNTVFAMSNRDKCYCGEMIPNDGDKAADDNCSLSCPGYPDDNCGGVKYFMFYDNGISTNIPKAEQASSPTDGAGSSSATSARPSVVTAPGQTVVVTSSGKPTGSSASGGGGPSKAGIAAGVVIGIVAIAGIIGGLFFFMRSRKRRAIEEEHRRNAEINAFTKPPTSSGATSFTDTRLDPVMAQRRMSDGSIADNQDYSRRILKVTNA